MSAHRLPSSAVEGDRPLDPSVELTLPVLEGKLPEDIQGKWYVVTAIGEHDWPHPRIPRRAPVLNGDGVLYAIEFNGGKATACRRILENSSYVADTLIARSPEEYPKYRFKNVGLTRVDFPTLGVRDQSNTSLTPFRVSASHTPQILACYDAGRPHVVDPATLQVLGPIGALSDWEPQAFDQSIFPLIFSGAHPAMAHEDGTLFMANHGRSGLDFIQRLGALVPLPWRKAVNEAAEERVRSGDRTPGAIENSIDDVAPGLLDAAREMSERELEEAEAYLDTHSDFDFDIWAEEWSDFSDDEPTRGPMGPTLKAGIAIFKTFIDVAEYLFGIGLPPASPFVRLLKRSQNGLERYEVEVDGKPIALRDTMHQIGVTRRFVVLADTQFKFDLDLVLPFHFVKGAIRRWARRRVSRVQNDELPLYIVRRSDLTETGGKLKHVSAQKVVLPRGSTHWLVNYEDDNGIEILAVHGNATDIAEFSDGSDLTTEGHTIDPLYIGNFGGPTDLNEIGVYRIILDDDGRIEVFANKADGQGREDMWAIGLGTGHGQPGLFNGDLRETYWSTLGLIPGMHTQLVLDMYFDKNRYPRRLVPREAFDSLIEKGGVPSLLFRVTSDFSTHTPTATYEDIWAAKLGTILGSPQIVHSENRRKWLLCTSYSEEEPSRQILVFNASDIAQGPVARLDAENLRWPYTLHSCWLDPFEGEQHDETWAVNVEEDLVPRRSTSVDDTLNNFLRRVADVQRIGLYTGVEDQTI